MIKITQADKWFGKCVKERAGWRCEKCGKQYQEGDQGLHASHFWSRRYQSVRHHPDNAAAHCFGCHQRLTGNPLEFSVWVHDHLGTPRVVALNTRKNTPLKIRRYEKEIAAHYRGQFDYLKMQRGLGHTGRLEFDAWEP